MAPSKGHSGKALLLGLLWGLWFCAATWGVEFAGGTGEPNDPYQIATAEQLLAIGSGPHLTEKHYVLVASIDMSGTTLSWPVAGWFLGTFDGKGHTIRNPRMQGGFGRLFDTIDAHAEVRNLGVVDVQMTGTPNPAALASWNSGSIVNCYSTGTVTGTGGFAGGLVAVNTGTVTNSYSTVKVTGGGTVGGLVAQNFGTISGCYSTGAVTGSTVVGGLAGFNGGVITASHAVATVTALSMWAGGLVGTNGGRIMDSYAQATVTAQYDLVGGLVGQNSTLISGCYATGSVTGQNEVGGLVGSNLGLITSSYSDATVVGYGRSAGGLAGDSRGAISACYSTGSAETGDEAGGLVGSNSGKISMSYSVAPALSYGWYAGGLVGRGSTGTSSVVGGCYFLAPSEGGGPDNGIASPLTSAQMKQQASFVGWGFWGTALDGANAPWFMPAHAYPVLVWQTEITGLRTVPNVAGLSLDEAKAALTAAGFVPGSVRYDWDRTLPGDHVVYATPYPLAAAGSAIDLVASSGGFYNWATNTGVGTADHPYRIETAGQLESLIDHPELWDRQFVLSADLDMSGRTYSKALIAPDVEDSRGGGFQGTPFSGTFSGQGHAIRNLTIDPAGVVHDYVGLFGMIAQGGRIDNLDVLDADITGGTGTNSYVGAVAGYNAGTITDCSATGMLEGGKGDGLVGFNGGSLINCHADTTRI
ncbi:MAG: PASTA domain-containing protein [Phycisphaerae bacterium]|nr:PASTA domain-containing protein [Phycisphaerae bacterium]